MSRYSPAPFALAAVGAIAPLNLTGCGKIQEMRFEHAAKAKIVHDAIDPESVQFRDTHASPSKKYEGTFALCGEANAKNRMGGFTGWTRFIVSGFADNHEAGVISLTFDDGRGAFFDRQWAESCSPKNS